MGWDGMGGKEGEEEEDEEEFEEGLGMLIGRRFQQVGSGGGSRRIQDAAQKEIAGVY